MLNPASPWLRFIWTHWDEVLLALTMLLVLTAVVLRLTRGLEQWARWLMLSLIPLRFAWALLFLSVAPNLVTSTDSARYLAEVHQIAQEPLAWNPLTGRGPGYRASAKLGMSWLYGTLAHLFDVDPDFMAFLAGIVFSFLSILLAFELAKQTSPEPVVWLGTALFVGLNPQSLYWSGKIVRENLTVFLVAALFLVGLKLIERARIPTILLFLALTLALALTRAQLALFGPMILLAIAWAHFRTRIGVAGIALISIYALMPTLKNQIQLAGIKPRELLAYLSPTPEFLLDAARRTMTSHDLIQIMPHRFDSLGWLMLPFSLSSLICLIVALLRFRSLFAHYRVQAATLIVCSLVYIAVLAEQGAINFRAQATTLPILAPIVVAGAWYLAGKLSFGSAPLSLSSSS